MASRLRRSAGDGGEQRVARGAGALAQPGLEDRFGRGHQRCSSFFAALADGVHVGAGGERDVLAGESGEFGDPQTGLDGQGEHGVVAPAGPGGLVAGRQQRVDLGFGEVGDQVAFGAFGRDGEHPLDGAGVLGMLQGEVAEQRVDRGQPVVAGGHAVVSVAFEVVQERGDQRRVELGDVEGAGCLAGAFGGEGQQQPEGDLVGGDRVRARGALADQPVGEVGLQRRARARSWPGSEACRRAVRRPAPSAPGNGGQVPVGVRRG